MAAHGHDPAGEGAWRRTSLLLVDVIWTPFFQAPEFLHRLQIRSPFHALSKLDLHLRHFRICGRWRLTSRSSGLLSTGPAVSGLPVAWALCFILVSFLNRRQDTLIVFEDIGLVTDPAIPVIVQVCIGGHRNFTTDIKLPAVPPKAFPASTAC